MLTLVAFCAGVLLGARDGGLVGGVTMLLFSLLNPYGPAHPLVTAAQVLGSASAGVAGALFARAGLPGRSAPVRAAMLAIAALLVTAFFDLITNVATGLVFGTMRVWLVGGIPYSLWHIGTNIALFVALGTSLTAVCARYAERLSA